MLSELLAWPTDHLTQAASHWEAVGRRCYGVASRVWQDSLSVDWQGHAADKLRVATYADMMTTSAVADQLHEAAKVARGGASDLYAARSRVRYIVEDARTAGFFVAEDLSVTDRSTDGSAAQRATRQAQAQTFAGDIRQRAAQLVGVDQQVAAKITSATADIRDAFPQTHTSDTPRKHNRVQAVDNHTWKQDPTPAPNPGRTASEVREAIKGLPRGSRPNYLEVRSPDDIRKFWDWATENAPPYNPSKPYRGGNGIMRQLPDGTIVGLGPSDGHGPTIDFRFPDGEPVKLHINPVTGGVPDIPAPAGPASPKAPAARAPVEPPLSARPPLDLAPGRGGPAPPLVGGGPVPPESIPHPVHPPHSHHGPPVLGKDELPDLDEFSPG